MALRGGLALLFVSSLSLGAGLVFVACGDDESSGATSGDGGPDSVTPNPTVTTTTPPPPNFPDAPAPPPDLVSRSGFMGNATLVADLGAPTDGPAWRAVDGALYFTMPGSPTPLRRVVPGGTPSIVAVDAGSFAPVGIATSGGAKLYVTERESLGTLDLDDAGVASAFTRVNGLGGTAFTDIASLPPQPTSYFVDNTSPRLYRFVPPSEMSLLTEIPDAGRTMAIAARVTTTSDNRLYIGVSAYPDYGSAILVYDVAPASAPELQDVIGLQGIPPNGIAVDNTGRIFVAWADGIDVFTDSKSGQAQRPADGHAALPIGAIPTSLTFGGADNKTLFVTTNAGKIYSIPVQTAGQPR